MTANVYLCMKCGFYPAVSAEGLCRHCADVTDDAREPAKLAEGAFKVVEEVE